MGGLSVAGVWMGFWWCSSFLFNEAAFQKINQTIGAIIVSHPQKEIKVVKKKVWNHESSCRTCWRGEHAGISVISAEAQETEALCTTLFLLLKTISNQPITHPNICKSTNTLWKNKKWKQRGLNLEASSKLSTLSLGKKVKSQSLENQPSDGPKDLLKVED